MNLTKFVFLSEQGIPRYERPIFYDSTDNQRVIMRYVKKKEIEK